MPTVRIRNILFDLGNVLVDLDMDLWTAEVLEFFDVSAMEELPPILFEKIHEYERGEISTSLFINHMLRNSPRDRQALDAITCWNSMLLGIRYHRLDVLAALTQKYKLYVLSNTNALHIEWIDKYLMKRLKFPAFYGLFEEIYLSHEIKKNKPGKDSFQFVIDDSGIRPEETLYLDDRQENLDVAAALGFHSVFVPPTKEVTELLDELGLLT